MTPASHRPLLSVQRISKTFPGVHALSDVNLDLLTGEILAVVGQNGSGKSTLVKILTGVYEADPGGALQVHATGNSSVAGAAAQAHIHVIHQDLGLVGSMTALDNLHLGAGRGTQRLTPISRRREEANATELLERLGLQLDLSLTVDQLAPGERALVAIARALDGWQTSEEILLLDEPTTALHDAEARKLFTAVRNLAAQGAGVIFISHRLDEVLGVADRVLALRGGRVAADVSTKGLDSNALIRVIVGRDLPQQHRNNRRNRERNALVVRDLATARVHGVSFSVNAGEVVGVSGILGSGREDIASAVFGAQDRLRGQVQIAGRDVPAGSPAAAMKRGMAYVPADRAARGAVMTMRARENLTLPGLTSLRGRAGSLKVRAERLETARWVDKVQLDPPLPERPLELFSGGNQQKIVLAKWLRNNPAVLLLDEPTQGVDVAAKAAVYELILNAAAEGAAVLLASSDTAELAAICDRVLVLRDGALAASLDRYSDDISEEALVAHSMNELAREGEPA